MPRKKQRGPPPRSNRPGPPKPGPSSQPKAKGSKQDSGAAKDAQKKAPVQANQRPIVPFLRGDRILLIGEGDFSFARSLAKQYKCRKLLATCYDSQETLFEKYPQAEQNINDILHSKPKSSESQDQEKQKSTNSPKVLFSIDARKLGAQGGGGKEIKNGFPRRERKIPAWKAQQQPPVPKPASGPWDVICFNFPHVGGISTDVNRQVRFNQELLVAFFKACVPLLSAAPDPVDSDDEWEGEDEDEDEDEEEEEEDAQTSGKASRTGPGQILVSLFEAEPYTLWNIKDLARHAGLQVITSFRFPWTSYEGYSHARTLGEVEGKNEGRGGWRGEDREARMYVFEVKKLPFPCI
ncbi:uncharacterized protein N7498_002916 [Penicillium cinerascens]|uniref:25S rRNA (uridine-N(3))-methyltransferase BMT5-like domain-containing protein n=1 Tax=Penicillium cinerascens TaxID=70096 RepID=A0A9W9NAY8_9EURO|nr:uncharacterized protein N7498_002916 [Penicillium cinerascens]KAJ5216509.1 hypothetical protein N7498_002916 [Penicillium cinerascens]